MAKTDNRPVEQMKLNIEFADNGIILRNPELEDDVLLALTGDYIDRHGYDHKAEYQAIGKKIYDWLVDVAVPNHGDEWITTGAELNIKATLAGRKM